MMYFLHLATAIRYFLIQFMKFRFLAFSLRCKPIDKNLISQSTFTYTQRKYHLQEQEDGIDYNLDLVDPALRENAIYEFNLKCLKY